MVNLHRGGPGRRSSPMKLRRQRGSVLLITLTFTIIMTISALSVLDLSMNTYRLAMRNQLRAEARAVGESEMEYIYFQFKAQVLAGNAASATPGTLEDNNITDNATTPTTVRNPFLALHQSAGWTVKRSLVLDRGPISGRIPGTTKVGQFTYLIARVEVIPPASNPFAASAYVRVGRRFINSNTSIFQYSVFFEGDLELNPGTDVTINGDVVANGSIYMGPISGKTLTLNNKVRYLAGDYFNVTSGGATIYSNPNAPAPPVTLVAPTFGTSSASQLETIDEPENLLGGIDVSATAQGRPDLFGPSGLTDPTVWTSAQLDSAENNVHRSLIVAPPSSAASTEYPNATSGTGDDSVLAVRRAYNRAGLIVTVTSAGAITTTKVESGVATDVTSTFSSVFTAPANVYDAREAKNVKMTDINISTLKTKLDALRAATDSTHFEFNGLMYINLLSSTSSTPAAVRLLNGTNLPVNNSAGFSVATNGGIYVKGSYNTTLYTNPDGTTRNLPAMLIGDAVTVLSSNWSDLTAALPLASRIATSGTTYINAGLLTGNIPSSGTNSSGGAQNLVRYLENWSGCTVSYLGSIGRLFTSTNFVAPYPGSGTVYIQPNRLFSFDSNYLTYSPPGTPTTTSFSRGGFFTW